MIAGQRVLYIPPAGDTRPVRLGTIKDILGVSALVIFDDISGPQGAPLCRLVPVERSSQGWLQLCLDEKAHD
jgi:hypothetical protein